MWCPQRQAPTLSALGKNHGSLLRREAKQLPVRSEVGTGIKLSMYKGPRALGWVSRTISCLGLIARRPSSQMRRGESMQSGPLFPVNDPWQGHFPARTPVCISGKIGTQIKH